MSTDPHAATEVPEAPSAPGLQFVFEARVTIGPPVELGEHYGLRRRMVPITGGTVAGPRLSGSIVPGGADWQEIHADGLTELVARYAIRAQDGTPIPVVNTGIRHAPTEVMQKLLAGQPVDPALVYFRTVPVFHPPAGAHAWLGRSIFVGVGERQPELVVIRVFELR